MSYTYEYTGEVPTVFISIKKDGKTWVPDTRDKVTLDYPVSHPCLELVGEVGAEEIEDVPVTDNPKSAKKSVPVLTENTTKPATADKSKEN